MQVNLPYEDTVMLWNDVVEMAHDLPDASILPWLERVSPVSLENSVMTVSTRQNWTARKLAGEYRPVIEQLLNEITLEQISLDVVVTSSAAAGAAPASTAASAATVQPSSDPHRTTATNVEVVAAGRVTTTPSSTFRAFPSDVSRETLDGTITAGNFQGQPARLSPAALAGAAVAASRAAKHGGASDADPTTANVDNSAEYSFIAPTTPTFAEQTCASEPTHSTGAPFASPKPAVKPEQPAPDQASIEDVVPILEDGALPKTPSGSKYSDFNFDTYIVGESNKLAFGMARTVAEQPGSVANINPLFIWGQSGYGKTHLLLSILNYLREHQPEMNVQYVPANAFVDQYIDDIRNRGLKGKKVLEVYRSVDVLLVDDVQSFEAKQESVSTFFDIFNQLIFEGKQIVLAADTPPDYLRLDDRMRTRFSTGAVVDITAPTYEMKLSILHSYYERCRARMDWCDVEIPGDVFSSIAQLAPNNPRNMQGLMTSIMIKASNDPSILSPGGIKETIRELFKANEAVTMSSIIRKVCEAYGVTADDIRGKSRTKVISEARQVTMWLARQLTDESYENIGAELGGRDHSTVYYGISTIEKRSLEDKGYLYRLDNLKKEIVG